jgi:hypothetical protein
MGKDNVQFHTVIFPSSLLGTGEDWTLLYHINTTGERRIHLHVCFFLHKFIFKILIALIHNLT